MIKGKYIGGDGDLSEPFSVRREVFCDEQGISPDAEFDSMDKYAVHAIVYGEAGTPVATGRITFDGKTYMLGHIAVIKSARKSGYGDFTVRMLLDRAFMNGAHTVHVHAQLHAVPFYEKLGFTVCGDEMSEKGLPHLPMCLELKNVKSGCGHNCFSK